MSHSFKNQWHSSEKNWIALRYNLCISKCTLLLYLGHSCNISTIDLIYHKCIFFEQCKIKFFGNELCYYFFVLSEYLIFIIHRKLEKDIMTVYKFVEVWMLVVLIQINFEIRGCLRPQNDEIYFFSFLDSSFCARRTIKSCA